MKRILIAGGSGLIGSALREAAEAKGYSVTILSRKPQEKRIVWDPANAFIDLRQSTAFDAVINLAGASIADKRWTAARRHEILSSRLDACSTLDKYISEGIIRTDAYIGSSGIGVYGDSEEKLITEEDQPALPDTWLSSTVLQWENAHQKIHTSRVCILRTGIVLSTKGGALAEILKKSPPFVYPYFGNGRQYWSWIHIEDMVGMILHCINNTESSGMYHATAPVPVSNKDLMQKIRSCDKKPSLLIGIPDVILKGMLGALHQPLMDSARVLPNRLIQEGYDFQYTNAETAIRDLLNERL